VRLTELRQYLEGEVLEQAETLRWPRFELRALGRRGYVLGTEAWRALCPSLSFSELRALSAVLATTPTLPAHPSPKNPSRRVDAMTIKR
jgi:hypothetical protein